MASPKCLARLTSWETTNSPIGTSTMRTSIVKLCKNIPRNGQLLCDDCSERPTDGKYQTKIRHGLLTEEPCAASHIYGSSWYWGRVAKYGDPSDEHWIETAKRCQQAAEAFCLSAGHQPWRVQRPSESGLEEMRTKKAKEDKVVAAKRVEQKLEKEKEKQKQQNLTKFIVPIKVIYEESAKQPERLPTDTCEIWEEVVNDVAIWVAENGMVFEKCETTGEPGEFLGRRVNGEFIPLAN
jgi:hypothetical protein